MLFDSLRLVYGVMVFSHFHSEPVVVLKKNGVFNYSLFLVEEEIVNNDRLIRDHVVPVLGERFYDNVCGQYLMCSQSLETSAKLYELYALYSPRKHLDDIKGLGETFNVYPLEKLMFLKNFFSSDEKQMAICFSELVVQGVESILSEGAVGVVY